MSRLYGEEQRQAIIKTNLELIAELESLYLSKFDDLNTLGFGSGAIVKLTQLFLLSRDGAITPLKDEVASLSMEKEDF